MRAFALPWLGFYAENHFDRYFALFCRRGIGYMEFFDRDDNFPTELVRIIEEFEEKNKPVRIYQARGAGGQGGGKSILHNSTAAVLKEADGCELICLLVRPRGCSD